MYKLIVVDDNKRELGYVQGALDWRQHKIEIVGTYTSPLEALRQIPGLMPDIILSDVVMPYMNGFELISQALTFNPDLLNIFMSCHEDFQYAKAAVDVSACSYLLKPLIQEELEETICKTVSRLEQKEMERLKNSSMEEMISQSLDGLREQFFFELSSGEFSSKDEVGERMKLLQLGNLLDSDICIINLKFQREHEVFQQMEARRSYYNLFYTQKTLSESFTFAKEVQKFSKSSETLTCVLFLDRQTSEENHAGIDETVISLVEQISGELKGNIVVGISDIANDLLQMPVLYAQSITALEANFFAGINPIIWYHEVAETFEKPAEQKEISIDTLSHQLKRVWISGSREKVEEFVDEVFSVTTDYSEYRWSEGMVDTLDFYENLRRTLHAIYQTNQYYNVLNIYVTNKSVFKGDILRSIDELGEEERAYALEESTSKPLFYLSKDGRYVKHYKVVRSPFDVLGIVESSVDLNAVLKSIHFPNDKLSIVMYNKNNGEYSNIYTAQPVEFERMSHGFIMIERKNHNGFPVYYCVAKSDLQAMQKEMIFVCIMFGVVLSVIMFVVVKLVTTLLTRKLYKITNSVRFEGEFIRCPAVTDTSMDEFGDIEELFRSLITKLNGHLETENQLKRDYQKLELELLQAKINPHFLYNTLSAIKITSEDKGLGKIIDSLVHYYRITLSRGEDIIPISREVEMVREYVQIQQFSYDIAFEFNCEVDACLQENVIQKLTLQPFIENAILHGINGVEKGKIWLTIRDKGEQIEISIRDNGLGMPTEQLSRLEQGLEQGQYSGYGFYNSVMRLKMFFQSRCSFEIKSDVNEGTTITMLIPKLTREELG